MKFLMPPVLQNEQGEIRTVGFELEFAETGLETTADCIINLYGGSVKKVNKFHFQVLGTSLGDFNLELDIRLLTEKSYEKFFHKIGIDLKELYIGGQTLDIDFENAIESIASLVVPYEIGAPPIPFTKIEELDKLREALFEHDAKGTKSSVFYAFATHINVELPKLDIETVIRYTRAFFVLYPWLTEQLQVSFTRKITPFINPFPDEYVHLVLKPIYRPNLNRFIDEYYQYNPDRNRPLDLYPVLAYMDNQKIASLPDVGKLRPRPAFHYRNPNSLIDNPEWSLATEWNCWVKVENLASEPEILNNLSLEYLRLKRDTLIGFKNKWIERIETFLNDSKK